MKLFALGFQEIGVVITCYQQVLKPKGKSSAFSVKSSLRQLEGLVKKAFESGRLPDEDLYLILLLIARYPWISVHFRKERVGICAMIIDIYKHRPYDLDMLRLNYN
ncbi:hypothetical protein [Pseudomonas viridiflava]|uniref:hypothetical protein n=1 Tax=Pseudomonas viridiflava TaxID=33069 RepID=UPI000F02A342|nr:hypothetical protein [Pseudomonas viridiflava]